MSLTLLARSHLVLHLSVAAVLGILDHQAGARLQFACFSPKVQLCCRWMQGKEQVLSLVSTLARHHGQHSYLLCSPYSRKQILQHRFLKDHNQRQEELEPTLGLAQRNRAQPNWLPWSFQQQRIGTWEEGLCHPKARSKVNPWWHGQSQSFGQNTKGSFSSRSKNGVAESKESLQKSFSIVGETPPQVAIRMPSILLLCQCWPEKHGLLQIRKKADSWKPILKMHI